MQEDEKKECHSFSWVVMKGFIVGFAVALIGFSLFFAPVDHFMAQIMPIGSGLILLYLIRLIDQLKHRD